VQYLTGESTKEDKKTEGKDESASGREQHKVYCMPGEPGPISHKLEDGRNEGVRTHELRVRVDPVAVPPPTPALLAPPRCIYVDNASPLTTAKPATWYP
jgi:hypothetical protein